VEALLKKHAPETFEELAIPLAVPAVDIQSAEMLVLKSGPLIPAVSASNAFPGLFTPVEHLGRQLMDGGILNNVPVDLIRTMTTAPVVVVDVRPSPKEKIEGLEEAVRIVRGLWSEPAYTYDGAHHRTVAADLEPKPQHDIPIWLGTFGRRALAVTGRLADGWIPSLAFAPPNEIPKMHDRIVAAAEEVGRDPMGITFVYNVEVRLDSTTDADPHVVSGSPEAVADQLRCFIQLGFDGMNLVTVGPNLGEQVERLGTEVVPRLRDNP
jgi:hypothetical protein